MSEDGAVERALRPWPPPPGESPVLDLVMQVHQRSPAFDRAYAERLFTPDLVITAPPVWPSEAFRHYFGVSGAFEAFRYDAQAGFEVVPERYVARGDHAAIVARIAGTGGDRPAGWLCSAREGRLAALRGFRYPSEALARFAALMPPG